MTLRYSVKDIERCGENKRKDRNALGKKLGQPSRVKLAACSPTKSKNGFQLLAQYQRIESFYTMSKKKSNAALGCLLLVLIAAAFGAQLIRKNPLASIPIIAALLLLGIVAAFLFRSKRCELCGDILERKSHVWTIEGMKKVGRMIIARKKNEKFEIADMNNKTTRDKSRKMQASNDLDALFE